MTRPVFVPQPPAAAVARPWSIVVGLTPGYGDDTPQPAHRVTEVHQRWMLGRIHRGEPYLTCLVTPTTLSYAWPRPEPADDGTITGHARTEPAVRLHGEVSVLYQSHLDDVEVTVMLDDLAAELGGSLDQQRVYLRYRTLSWVIERQ